LRLLKPQKTWGNRLRITHICMPSSTNVIQLIFTALEEHLNIKCLGNLSWILGMRVTHNRGIRHICLDQTTYINALI
jgi:hypothetical protein